MSRISEVLGLFGNFSASAKAENFEFYSLSGTIAGITLPSKDDFITAIKSKFPNSSIKLIVSINDDPLTFSSEVANEDDFLNGLAGKIKYIGSDDDIQLSLIIEKDKSANFIEIYDSKIFFDWLLSLSPNSLIKIIAECLNEKNKLVVVCEELKKPFYTKTLLFTSTPGLIPSPFGEANVLRRDRKERINAICYDGSTESYCIIPEDFKFIEPATEKTLISQFDKCCFLLCLKSLFDYSTLSDKTIGFKLNGYKTITDNIGLETIRHDSVNEYYHIYEWVYENLGVNDKIGIARNIISLNIDRGDNYSINSNVFESVKSAYKVYEQQNVKQYIDLRNKISDQILDFSEKANKIIESFATGFQKSALAFVSLYATIIVIRVLTTNNFTNIFTLDAVILSDAFLGVSLLYFFVARWEVGEQKKRFEESYNNMKERNKDLLTEADISRILNNDKAFNQDILFIRKKLRYYSMLWIGFIIVFFLATGLLYIIYNISNIFNAPIMKLLFSSGVGTC
jgi:hypothetical protein